MTVNAKEYLGQYMITVARLKNVEASLQEIRTELANLTSVEIRSAWPDGQPHGTGTTDPVGERAAADADAELGRERDRLRSLLRDLEVRELRARSDLWKKRNEIENVVGKVSDPVYNRLLHMRYIEGETMERIAVDIGFSWRHTNRLHSEALQIVAGILKKSSIS